MIPLWLLQCSLSYNLNASRQALCSFYYFFLALLPVGATTPPIGGWVRKSVEIECQGCGWGSSLGSEEG